MPNGRSLGRLVKKLTLMGRDAQSGTDHDCDKDRFQRTVASVPTRSKRAVVRTTTLHGPTVNKGQRRFLDICAIQFYPLPMPR